MTTTAHDAAQRRAEAAGRDGDKLQRNARSEAPGGVQQRRAAPVASEVRSAEVERDGKKFLRLTGNASVYERGYEMWDWAGPYTEIVTEGAGAASLAKGPDVVFLLNHTGIPFARTGRNGEPGTLDLSEPGGALLSEAYLNPTRQDVRDLVASVEDGSTTEMSFAFRIDSGQWSPDYTEYRINAFDLDRGDTSVVTFGANPHTSVEARAAQFALTNDVLRAARALDSDQRELLADAIGAVSAPGSAGGFIALKIGARAAKDLRHLRAEVAQGGPLDVAARSSLAAVIDDILDGGPKLAGDGPLEMLLGLRMAPPEMPPAVRQPMRLDFLEAEQLAARTLG